MIPKKINKQITNAFICEMDEKYRLVYSHYDDSFNNSAKTVQECMENQDPTPLFYAVDDWIYDCRYDASKKIVDELKDKILMDSKYYEVHPYIEDWISDDDNKDFLRSCIEERDYSEPVKEMIAGTRLRARITQHTNHDCLPSIQAMNNTHYYCDYLKDIIDTLKLNPAKVKRALIDRGIKAVGKWPNFAYRTGKEAVEYDDFAREIVNQHCYSHFVFMGMFPLESMYNNDFKGYKKIVIPEGNSCGFFCSWNGAASILNITLKRDLELPLRLPGKTAFDRFDLDVDEPGCINGYCIDEVCGMVKEAWGKEFRLIYKSYNRKKNDVKRSK